MKFPYPNMMEKHYNQQRKREMDVLLIVFLMLTFLTKCSCMSCGIPECEFLMRVNSDEPSMFAINDKILPFQGKAYLMESSHSSECYMNLTRYMETMFDVNEPAVLNIALYCRHPLLVHITSLETNASFSEIWLYLQISQCKLTTQSISRIARTFELQVLTLMGSYLELNYNDTCFSNEPDDRCFGLLASSSFWLTGSMWYEPMNITDIFACNESFRELSELILNNLTFSETSEDLAYKFPKLQSLEVTNNTLIKPMDFPWNPDKKTLEKNISMLDYFMAQYVNVFHIDIEPTVYRRAVNLNYNNISSLSGFRFRGPIDMIQLKNNSITYLDQDTFYEATGVQHIDLSNNRISELYEKTFEGVTTLRHLSFKNNLLKALPKGVFNGLTELLYLDLSGNLLSELPSHVFGSLSKLQEIHLENNKLSIVNSQAFFPSHMNLQILYFDNNPIKMIPAIIFYLRKLDIAYFRNTLITFANLTILTESISYAGLMNSLLKSSSGNMDVFEVPSKLRRIDLSGSQVSEISIYDTYESLTNRLMMILINFHFILNNNPILCDCHLNSFYNWVHNRTDGKRIRGNEYFFKEWKCQQPIEFKDRTALSVKPGETYCEQNLTNCPIECKCYVRSFTGIIIVDCHFSGLTDMPNMVPSGTLDLWFDFNNISNVSPKSYFADTRRLNLSHNDIDKIDAESITSLTSIEQLYLDANLIASVPQVIKELTNTEVTLRNNPLKCDCNSLWMKKWLMTNQKHILDWSTVSCNKDDDEGQQVISVPDEEFICVEEFDEIKHVIIPSVFSSIAVSLMFVGVVLLYLYRMEVKVIIFIYTGFHPFDQDKNDIIEDVDALIVHAPSTREWVMENIVHYLEESKNKYSVCCQTRDFVAGFSLQENIVTMTRRSKRMFIVLSADLMDTDDLFKVSWNEAQDKIQQSRANYVIAISHEIPLKKLSNKEFVRYIKRGRFIYTSDTLVKEKSLYSLFYKNTEMIAKENKKEIDIKECIMELYENEDITREVPVFDIFLSYGDHDRAFAITAMRQHLEGKHLNILLPDRDFMPGFSKEENILRAINTSDHTIFVFSGNYLQDEWSLFTFRAASEKSLRKKCNHLILVTTDKDGESEVVDEEVKHYLNTHVTLQTDDNIFWKRLEKCLPSKANANLENGHVIPNGLETVGPKQYENGGYVNFGEQNDKPLDEGNVTKRYSRVEKVGTQTHDNDITVSEIIRSRQKEIELQIEADIKGVDLNKIIYLHQHSEDPEEQTVL